MTRHEALAKLSDLPDSDALDLARFLLKHDGSKHTGSRRVKAGSTISLWQIRLAHSETTHQILYGARELIETLERLPRAFDLEKHTFVSSTIQGIFYFNTTTGGLAGLVIVYKPAPPRQAEDGH